MLKYEKLAVVGDKLKSFDFEPMEGRRDRYVEGYIIKLTEQSYAYGYLIYCIKDAAFLGDYNRVGEHVFVPYETSMEFDDRVTVVPA